MHQRTLPAPLASLDVVQLWWLAKPQVWVCVGCQDDPRHLRPRHRRQAGLHHSRTRTALFLSRLLTRLSQRAPETLPRLFVFVLFAGLFQVAGPGFEPGTP
jgi:hypothetical protein